MLGVSRTTSRTEQISRTALRILIAALDLRTREWGVEGDCGPSPCRGKEDEEHGTAMVDAGLAPIGCTHWAWGPRRPHTTLRGFRGRTAVRIVCFLTKVPEQRMFHRVARVPCSGRDPGKLHGAPDPFAQGLGEATCAPFIPVPCAGTSRPGIANPRGNPLAPGSRRPAATAWMPAGHFSGRRVPPPRWGPPRTGNLPSPDPRGAGPHPLAVRGPGICSPRGQPAPTGFPVGTPLDSDPCPEADSTRQPMDEGVRGDPGGI